MGTDFTDLKVWKQAHTLTLEVYRVTADFPSHEQFGLTSQLRRAAISVELNIAESQGRFHYLDSVRLLVDARASIFEVRAALLIARDLGYLKKDRFKKLDGDYLGLSKQVNSLISYKRGKANVKK